MKSVNLVKNKLTIIFQLTFTVSIFWYLFNNYSLFLNLDIRNESYLILTLLIKSLNIFLIAAINLLAFSIFNSDITYKETLKIHITSLFGNFFSFAKSGTAYKALTLKQRFNLNIKEFTIFFFVNQMFAVLAISFVTLIYFNFFREDKLDNVILLSIAIIPLTLLLAFNLISKKFKHTNFPLLFKSKNLLIIFLAQLISSFVIISANFFLSNTIGIELTFYDNLIYTLIAVTSIMISLTPNALGIREFLLLYFDNLIMLDSKILFNFSIADRLSDAFMLLIIYLIFIGKYKKLFYFSDK